MKTRTRPKEHLHASSSFNPSKLTCSTIHQAPSRPKTPLRGLFTKSTFHVRPASRCTSTLFSTFPHACIFLFFDWPSIIVTITGHTSPILCTSFSPTGNLLATGPRDTNVRLWGVNMDVLSGHIGLVLCVEWETMERKVASGGHDGHAGLFLDASLDSLINTHLR
jgi:WD40 repeat protein